MVPRLICDIWSVGHLITSCNAADFSNKFRDLGRRICEEAHILTAWDVLELVRSLPQLICFISQPGFDLGLNLTVTIHPDHL